MANQKSCVRWKVKKGGSHQGRKWVVLKGSSTTPAFHTRDWAQAMCVAVSLAHGNRIETLSRFGFSK